MVAAATAERGLIDTAEAEYEAYCAGERSLHYKSIAVEGGEVQYCGSRDDEARWSVAFVPAVNGAVVPLAVGPFLQVADRHKRLREAGVPLWDAHVCPPPFARVGGKRYLFRPGHGSVLVGVAETDECTVLLAADGLRLVAIYRAGKSRITVPVGEPQNFRELDVDSLLKHWSHAAPPTGSVEPPPKLQAHYIRLVDGVPVDVGAGPTVAEVMQVVFADLADQATARKLLTPGTRLKGKRRVRYVLSFLHRLGFLGCGDLEGLVGEIIERIKEVCPDFKISSEAFADVLNLLEATGTALLGKRDPGARIRRINLVGLSDPRSGLHRELCSKARTPFHFNEAANVGAGTTRKRARPSPEAVPAAPSVRRSRAGAASTVGIGADGCSTDPGEIRWGRDDEPASARPCGEAETRNVGAGSESCPPASPEAEEASVVVNDATEEWLAQFSELPGFWAALGITSKLALARVHEQAGDEGGGGADEELPASDGGGAGGAGGAGEASESSKSSEVAEAPAPEVDAALSEDSAVAEVAAVTEVVDVAHRGGVDGVEVVTARDVTVDAAIDAIPDAAIEASVEAARVAVEVAGAREADTGEAIAAKVADAVHCEAQAAGDDNAAAVARAALDDHLRHARALAPQPALPTCISLAQRPTLAGLPLDGQTPDTSDLGSTQLPPPDRDLTCFDVASPTPIRGTLGPRGPPA